MNAILPDRDGTIGGYSVGYLKTVLNALDPADPVPPRSVKLQIPREHVEKECGCHAQQPAAQRHNVAMSRSAYLEQPAMAASATDLSAYSQREIYVPEMISALSVFGVVLRLADIVVGRNATLFLDTDLTYGVFNNVFAYRGAKIIQRSPYALLDVRSTMRGGILGIFHTVSDVLKIDLQMLAAEPAFKP